HSGDGAGFCTLSGDRWDSAGWDWDRARPAWGADRSDPSGPGGRAQDGERALGAVFSGAPGRRLRARGAGRGGACHPGRGAGGRGGHRRTLGGGGAISPPGELAPAADGDAAGGGGDLVAAGVGRRPPPGGKITGVAGRYESKSALAPTGETEGGARPAG